MAESRRKFDADFREWSALTGIYAEESLGTATARLGAGHIPRAAQRHHRERLAAVSVSGGLPRSFWVLWSGTLINRFGYVVAPFLAHYLVGARGLSLTTAGAVLAVSGAGSVISQLIAGSLADQIGRRATSPSACSRTAWH
jgi:predicted MFS family arabinose efflux permease